MDNQNNTDTVTVGELFNAVDVICRAAANESSKKAAIEALSDQFNPEMFSMIGAVNDNFNDTLERMREAFGIKPEKKAFCNQ